MSRKRSPLKGKDEGRGKFSTSFITGCIAAVFLITGYQTAMFVHTAAVERAASVRDRPDTVFVIDSALARSVLYGSGAEGRSSSSGTGNADGSRGGAEGRSAASGSNGGRGDLSGGRGGTGGGGKIYVRKSSGHSGEVLRLREEPPARKTESFEFDPNTVSVEDLQRLGFTLRQATAIDNYRSKGGRFSRKSDFAKSYVVSDSVFARLEPFIRIPKLELNSADSAALLSLPGIGPFYASKILELRDRLGGFRSAEQLLDVYRFDRERYDGLSDLVYADSTLAVPFGIWTLPERELAAHPFIDAATAHGIVLFRENNPRGELSVGSLERAGVIGAETAVKLSRCRLAPP